MSRPAWVEQLQPEANEPVVPVEIWYVEFRALHQQVVKQTPEFDYAWLKTHQPALHAEIKAIEDQIDALGAAPLSKITELMAEWRFLMLKAAAPRSTELAA